MIEKLKDLLSTGGREKLKEWMKIKRLKGTPFSDSELYDSCIILKNLAIMQREKPLSADTILEILMNNSGRLKPIYGQMLIMYRSGKDQEAFSFFSETIGTKAGKNFGTILAKLNQINPVELVPQIEIFQNMMGEKRMTYAIKRARRNSWLTTFWATLTIFALMINFIVVVVLLNTLTMLEDIF